MRTVVAAPLLALVVSFSVAALARAADAPETPPPVTTALGAKIDAFVANATSGQGGAPAVAAAIVEDGKVAYVHVAGLADVADHRAADAQTRFRIGSITKMFTAVAVLQLVERGKIALDDPLAKYLPDAPHAGEVTIRELLMHTSGFPNYLDAALADGQASRPASPRELVATVAAEPLAFTPGTRYAYSNTGYVLLGMTVEKVTGASLAAYEREHVFAPAGMTQTTLAGVPSGTPLATGYAAVDGTPVPAYDVSWFYACGDGIATVSDLARFDVALMNGTLLKPETFALMRSQRIATGDNDGVVYGLGVALFPFADVTFVGHHGGMPGFASDNEMIPERRFATVVLGNASSFATPRVNGPLLVTLLPATSARALAARKAAQLTAAPGEDTALTARFRGFFVALQHGSVDRGEINATLSADSRPTRSRVSRRSSPHSARCSAWSSTARPRR